VTLNPLQHIDPLGTVIFPALMALGVGMPLAWGKPVEWTGNPRYLTRRFSMRTIRLMVSVAGPAMNLILALLLSVVLVVALRLHSQRLFLTSLYLVQMNLGLMFFNLLPIPPLDGRSFLEFLPDSLAMVRDFLMRYGSFVFLALIMLNGIGGGPSPLSVILRPFSMLIDLYVRLLVRLGGV
jgi:Zn-dependent protease